MSNLTVLDNDSLLSVTGGDKGSPSTRPSPSSPSGLTTQLAGLQSSIKDLAAAKPQAQSLFGGNNAVLMFAALAMNRPAPVAATNVVYVGRRHCW